MLDAKSCSFQFPHYLGIESIHFALTGKRNQFHCALLTGFKTYCRTGRDIQAHSIGDLPFELQGRIGFKEMEMRADLDRTVAAVGHFDSCGFAATVELELAW